MLGEHLGATLVESTDPLWTPDPDIETDEDRLPPRAGAARAGVHARPAVPARAGRPAAVQGVRRGDRADRVHARQDVRHRHDAADRLLRRRSPRDGSRRRAISIIATIQQQELAMAFRFHISQYLTRRAADWKARGFHRDAGRLAARSTRARSSGATISAPRSRTGRRSPIRAIRIGRRQGVNERIMLRELLRRVDMMVILENQPRRAGAAAHAVAAGHDRPRLPVRHRQQPRAGVAVRPERRPDRSADPGRLRHDGLRPGLHAQRRRHAIRLGRLRTRRPRIPAPGLPFSLVFRAEPGKEDVLLRIASTYEAASKRRVPPPNFGPLPA